MLQNPIDFSAKLILSPSSVCPKKVYKHYKYVHAETIWKS